MIDVVFEKVIKKIAPAGKLLSAGDKNAGTF